MRLIHGDCTEILPTLEDSSVDLIATDPPYYKVKGEAWDRQWDTPAGFLAWLDDILAEFYRILKPNGSLYLFASPKMAARVEVLVGERFNVLSGITWVKPDPSLEINRGAGRGGQASKETLRSWFPVQERIIFAEHYGADGYAKGEAGYTAKVDELRGFVFEPLRAYLAGERDRAGLTTRQIAEQFQKKTGSRTVTGMAGHWFERVQWALPTAENYDWLRATMSRLNHGGDYLKREYDDLKREYDDLKQEYEELRRPFNVSADVPYTDVWTFPTVSSYPGKHPCEKPLEMMRHIVRASSKPGAVVLDPFMGTGTTGVACEIEGREFIGIEQSEKYYQRAVERAEAARLPLFEL